MSFYSVGNILKCTPLPASAGFNIEITAKEAHGGILILPEGASFTRMRAEDEFIRSVRDIRAWIARVEEVYPGDQPFTVVTGHVKAKSWGIAAILPTTSHRKPCFNFLVAPPSSSSSSDASYWWQNYDSGSCHSGSVPSPALDNQCLFVRGFRIAKRKAFFLRRTVTERSSPTDRVSSATMLGRSSISHSTSSERQSARMLPANHLEEQARVTAVDQEIPPRNRVGDMECIPFQIIYIYI